MGVVCVTGMSVGVFTIFALYIDQKAKNVNSLVLPIIICAILSMLIVSVFLGQFSTCVIATINCFAVDCDLNNGEPQFGPPSYHEKIASVYRADK